MTWRQYYGDRSQDEHLAYFTTWCRQELRSRSWSASDGHRWAIEDSFDTKNVFGLDHNETRSWHGWHRHVSLVMLAFAMIHRSAGRVSPERPTAWLATSDLYGAFEVKRFLSAFARPEHPLALFLDDLQWLDAATLDLLEDAMTQPDVRHLMLVGAYRDNEVNSSHPLMRKLEAIRKTGAMVQSDYPYAPHP